MEFKKITAFVDNICYECKCSYPTPFYLIKHMADTHNIRLIPRPEWEERPVSETYEFTCEKLVTYERIVFGCPSCWFCSHSNLRELADHIRSSHLNIIPKKKEIPKQNIRSNKSANEEDLLKTWDKLYENLEKFLGTN